MLSAIGEPLRAEIDLSVSPEELDTVSPRLASVDDYTAAGLPYNPALNGARLAIQYRHNGRRVVDLVTMRPVNEPAIAVIVELEMRGGRTTRAYNVLLGPVADAPLRVAVPVAATPVAAVPPPMVNRASETRTAPSAAPRMARTRPIPRIEKTPVARADNTEFDRELKRLESQLTTGNKIITDMLARVTVMEREVAQLQKDFAALPAPQPVAEKSAAEKSAVVPVTEKRTAETAPVGSEPTKPAVAVTAPPTAPVMQEVQGQTTTRIDTVPRMSSKSNFMLNEALLVLAGGALALFIGLGYVLLGRRRQAKVAESGTTASGETQNAG